MNSIKNQVTSAIWSVVPAAGVGLRMGAALPKQYLILTDRTVIELALEKLLSLNDLKGVVVCTHPEDSCFAQLPISRHGRVFQTVGGDQRADSVLSGLNYLANNTAAKDDDWVLVHDAARPCVSIHALQRLIGSCRKFNRGAILAIQVADTLKKEVSGDLRIEATISREGLWQAHTPQCFKLAELRDALKDSLAKRLTLTDDASAMELAGHPVSLVEDSRDNIKITRPEDLALARFILENQSLNW